MSAPPRYLHPGAWWLWALGLAAAASRTTNPVLLVLLAGVAGYVVSARRAQRDGQDAFKAFLIFALVVIAIRVVFQVLFGATTGGSIVIVNLPEVPLPSWAAGVRIGGAVTLESVVIACYDGLRLAVILLVIGAANVLGDARRLLRSMPGALYEVGVALVVALTCAPRMVEDLTRVRAARRLRGHAHRPVRDLARVVGPVLEASLDNAIDLAAAMDARGFGRRATVPEPVRRASSTAVLAGLIGMCAGAYGLLGTGASTWAAGSLLVLGAAGAALGLRLAGRRSLRTRYRPDPWNRQEWWVSGSGFCVAGAFAWLAAGGAAGMDLRVVPLLAPDVPVLALLAAVVALTPAWLAPEVPSASSNHRRTRSFAAGEVAA